MASHHTIDLAFRRFRYLSPRSDVYCRLKIGELVQVRESVIRAGHHHAPASAECDFDAARGASAGAGSGVDADASAREPMGREACRVHFYWNTDFVVPLLEYYGPTQVSVSLFARKSIVRDEVIGEVKFSLVEARSSLQSAANLIYSGAYFLFHSHPSPAHPLSSPFSLRLLFALFYVTLGITVALVDGSDRSLLSLSPLATGSRASRAAVPSPLISMDALHCLRGTSTHPGETQSKDAQTCARVCEPYNSEESDSVSRSGCGDDQVPGRGAGEAKAAGGLSATATATVGGSGEAVDALQVCGSDVSPASGFGDDITGRLARVQRLAWPGARAAFWPAFFSNALLQQLNVQLDGRRNLPPPSLTHFSPPRGIPSASSPGPPHAVSCPPSSAPSAAAAAGVGRGLGLGLDSELNAAVAVQLGLNADLVESLVQSGLLEPSLNANAIANAIANPSSASRVEESKDVAASAAAALADRQLREPFGAAIARELQAQADLDRERERKGAAPLSASAGGPRDRTARSRRARSAAAAESRPRASRTAPAVYPLDVAAATGSSKLVDVLLQQVRVILVASSVVVSSYVQFLLS